MLTVIGIGFFGGELVYGTRTSKAEINDERVEKGAAYFAQKCAMCHHTDKVDKTPQSMPLT